jgi:nucleoside-diphosphate-sugar epimerase
MEEGMNEAWPGSSGGEPGGRVAVTGASGFIGRVLCSELARRQVAVVPVGRAELDAIRRGTEGDRVLSGCTAAVHLAARAHVLDEREADPLAAFRRANTETTATFANACVRARVRRLVFVSSIGVNGSASARPFRPDDAAAPDEPYAVSKLEAECALWQIAASTGLEVVVVRPPLVYGPEAKGNFLRLLKLAAAPMPLPLGRVAGRRTLVSVWNLVDLLIRCIEHPAAGGQTLLAGDAEDVDLPGLIGALRTAMGKPKRLVPVPETALRMVTSALGKRRVYEKLAGTLQVDVSHTRRLLDWTPPVSVDDGLARTARWYVESRSRAPAR